VGHGTARFGGVPLDELDPAFATLAPHHLATCRNVVAEFERQPEVLAVLLAGSIAHGHARPDSDVDIAIVVTPDEFERRAAAGRLTYFDQSLATWEGGYVDGKFHDLAFIRDVAERGSDQARYAFVGARPLLSRIDGLDDLLAAAVRYPVEEQAERVERFAAHMVAWRWYHGESIRLENRYLQVLGAQKVVLFACRAVLAANALLFPFHKWMLRVTADAANRPASMIDDIESSLADPSIERVGALCDSVIAHVAIEPDRLAEWPMHFMRDTELAWQSGHSPIDEI
jgi:predicted nucleotidyltransferase